MPANTIQAAQLLMNVLDKEQGKIGQKILKSEFSRELASQSDALASAQALPQATVASPALDLESSAQPTPTAQSPGNRAAPQVAAMKPTEPATSPQRARTLRKLTATAPVPESRIKVQEELGLTNSAALERVLAQFALPAEARQACKSAEDSQGRISLRALNVILDQYGTQRDQPGISTGHAAAEDVQKVLGSLQLLASNGKRTALPVASKAKGLYDLKSFRNLLTEAVAAVANTRESTRTSTLRRDSAATSASPSPTGSKPQAPSTPAEASGQRIGSSLLPSFGLDDPFDERKEHQPGSSLIDTSSALSQASTAASQQKTDSAKGDIPLAAEADVTAETRSASADAAATPLSSAVREMPAMPHVEAQSPMAGDSARVPGNSVSTAQIAGAFEQRVPKGSGAEDSSDRPVRARPLSAAEPPDRPIAMTEAQSESPLPRSGEAPQPAPEQIVSVTADDAPIRREPSGGPADRVPVAQLADLLSPDDALSENGPVVGRIRLSASPAPQAWRPGLATASPSLRADQSADPPTADAIKGTSPEIPSLVSSPEASSAEDALPGKPYPEPRPQLFTEPPAHAWRSARAAYEAASAQDPLQSNPWKTEALKAEKADPSSTPKAVTATVPAAPSAVPQPPSASEAQGATETPPLDEAGVPDAAPPVPSAEKPSSPKPVAHTAAGPAPSAKPMAGSPPAPAVLASATAASPGDPLVLSSEPTELAKTSLDPAPVESAPSVETGTSERLAAPDTSMNGSGQASSNDSHHEGQEETVPSPGLEAKSPGASKASQPMHHFEPALSAQPVSSPASIVHSGQARQTDNPAGLSLHDSQWPEDLAKRFQQLHQSSSQSGQLTIDLAPKELGHLTLRIETHHQEVMAWVLTDSDKARELIQQNAPALQQHLESMGLSLGQFSVDVRQGQQNRLADYKARSSLTREGGRLRTRSREATSSIASLSAPDTHPRDQLVNVFA